MPAASACRCRARDGGSSSWNRRQLRAEQFAVAVGQHAGIDRARLERWSKTVGWETLLNRAGTTFKKLPDADKAGVTEAKAIALMLAQPSMIKRPVLDLGGGQLLVGFKPDLYAAEIKA